MTWPLATRPYEVQLEAVDQANGREGFGWWLDPGLGKTSVTLAEIQNLYSEGKIDGALIVCPNSLKSVWKEEAEKHGADVEIHLWPDRMKKMNPESPFVAVINYEAVITPKGSQYIRDLLNLRLYGALDESICIANPKAQRTKRILGLAPEFLYRRALSGAPVNNGPHDLWAQLRWLGALRGVNYYSFRNRYCLLERIWNVPNAYKVVGVNPSRVGELNTLMSDWGFRARKSDWTDLPPKIYETRTIKLTKEQEKHMKNMLDYAFVELESGLLTVDMAATKYIKAQQISSGFYIDTDGELGKQGSVVELVTPSRNPKIVELKHVLKEIEGKAIIFAFFRYSVDLLESALAEYNPAVLRGGMKTDDIQAQCRRYENEASCRVLISQIGVGRYGHTWLGGKTPEDRCSNTIFYENTYSLNDRTQAEDRNHRHGQTDQTVTYHDLVSCDVEKKATKALQDKRDVAEAIVDGIKQHGAS